jgi:hypothetical protein
MKRSQARRSQTGSPVQEVGGRCSEAEGGEDHPESASTPLVEFGVLNDNLIKELILCVKCLSRF